MKSSDIDRLFYVLFAFTFIIFILLYRRVRILDRNSYASESNGVDGEDRPLADSTPADGQVLWRRRFYIIAVIALALRIAFASSIEGFHSDIACFKSWSAAAANNFIAIYDKNENWFIDYPPGYMYVLFILGKIRDIFSIPSDSNLFLTIIKLPSILSDVACGVILYHMTGSAGSNHRFTERARLLIAAVYLFNPVVFFISTVWGQVDSILALLVLCATLAYLGGRYYKSGILYALAVLLKPQGIIFLPVAFFMLLQKFIADKDIKPALKMIMSALATAVIIILPFSIRHGPLWILHLYTDTLTGYMLATMNAFNFFALAGANWLNDSEIFIGVSYATWGMIAIVVSTLLTGFFIFSADERCGKRGAYAMLMGSALIIYSVVTFGHRMHERYFYPVLPLLLAAYINGAPDPAVYKHDAAATNANQPKNQDRLMLISYCWITLSGFLNVLIVFSAFYTYTNSDFYGDSRIYIISAMNVAAAVFIWLIALRGGHINNFIDNIAKMIKSVALIAIVLSFAIYGFPAQPTAVYALGADGGFGGQPISIANPGFEDGLNDSGLLNAPPDWGVYDYRAQHTEDPVMTQITADTGIYHTGFASVRIESSSVNDVRLYQMIPVDPDSIYLLSCWIKTSGIDDSGVGANISALGVYAVSGNLKGTHEEFQKVELYGRTGPAQTDLWVAIGIGGYSNESFGVAWFDDVAVEKLEAAPQGAYIQKLYNEDTTGGNPAAQPNDMSPGARIILLLIILIILSIIVLIAMRKQGQNMPPLKKPDNDDPTKPMKVADNSGDSAVKPNARGEHNETSAKKPTVSAGISRISAILLNLGAGKSEAATEGAKRDMERVDMIIIAVMTAVYLVIALIRLGGFTAPQTYWKPVDDSTSVVFNFDGFVTLKKVYYNCNVADSYSLYDLYDASSEFAMIDALDVRGADVGGDAILIAGAAGHEISGVEGSGVEDSGVDGVYNGVSGIDGVYNGVNSVGGEYDVIELVQAGGSADAAEIGVRENFLCTIEKEAFYEWLSVNINAPAVNSVRLVAVKAGMALNEIAFIGVDASGKEGLLPVAINTGASVLSGSDASGVYNLIDEQETVPDRPDILNSTYFDEIYFARTAYEFIHSMPIYETTHPPLGKLIIAAGILIFGMNPFGWRIMGTLAGAAIIPVMYIFGKKLFGKRDYAFCAAFLMMFDFMLFAQTRLSTIDSYATLAILIMYLFMLDSFINGIHNRPLKETLIPLGASGLAFGLGVSVKWIALYAGAGLAFLFVLGRAVEIREVFDIGGAYTGAGQRAPARPRRQTQSVRRRRTRHRSIREQSGEKSYMLRFGVIIFASMLFFIIIPGLIYLLTYIPYTSKPDFTGGLYQIMLDNQKSMLDYHSKLTDTHPFESVWWKWPLDIKPIWYYSAQGLQYAQKASVASFGNPLVWWTGIPCLIAAFILAYRRAERRMAVVFTAFLFQFGPWIFISRATFIYHYFSSVPFLIFAIVYIIKLLVETKTISFRVVGAYLAAVAVLFFVYYPILSGLPISKDYSEKLRIFSTWLW